MGEFDVVGEALVVGLVDRSGLEEAVTDKLTTFEVVSLGDSDSDALELDVVVSDRDAGS